MTLRNVLDLLASDFYRDGGSVSVSRLLFIYLFRRDNRRIYILIRLARFFDQRGHSRLSKLMSRKMREEFGCIVSPKTKIGLNLRLPHPLGIVIGEGVIIGNDCTIYQQVTLGGARKGDWQAGRYPNVGNDVTLFAGAKILGDLEIGDQAVVGANAVVVDNVPANAIAVGVPAIAKLRGHKVQVQ